MNSVAGIIDSSFEYGADTNGTANSFPNPPRQSVRSFKFGLLAPHTAGSPAARAITCCHSAASAVALLLLCCSCNKRVSQCTAVGQGQGVALQKLCLQHTAAQLPKQLLPLATVSQQLSLIHI